MPTIEERIAYLEGRVQEHTGVFDELRDNVARLDARVGAIDQKIDRFREELAAAIRALDQKLDRRVDALDQKMSRQFLWIVGVQVAVLLAVVGALVRA